MYRRIVISVTSPQRHFGQTYLHLDVGQDLTVADLKARIQRESGFSPSQQSLYHNGQVLVDDSKTLKGFNIQDEDVLEMLIQGPNNGSSQSHAAGVPRPEDPETIRQAAEKEPRIVARIRSQDPELADAVPNPTLFAQRFHEMQQSENEAESRSQRELALLNANPFDVDAQRKIEEMIRKDRLMENLQEALQFSPEGKKAHSPASLPFGWK